MIIKSIVYEKEQKLQETMQALGMNEGIHWCSWFFDCIIPMVITVFVLSTVLVVRMTCILNSTYVLQQFKMLGVLAKSKRAENVCISICK